MCVCEPELLLSSLLFLFSFCQLFVCVCELVSCVLWLMYRTLREPSETILGFSFSFYFYYIVMIMIISWWAMLLEPKKKAIRKIKGPYTNILRAWTSSKLAAMLILLSPNAFLTFFLTLIIIGIATPSDRVI